MDDPKIRIALVSVKDEERNFLQNLMLSFGGILAEPYLSLSHLKNECRGKTFGGVIVDIFTLVCASTIEKDFFFSLQKGLPAMQVRRSPENNELSCAVNLKQDQTATGIEALASFLEGDCRRHPPRGIRLFPRKPVTMSIRLSLGANDYPLYATMGNLSQEGCLVFSPLRPLSVQVPIWLIFDAFKDRHPVFATICWKKDRSEDGKLELGIHFEDLSSLQQIGIAELLKSA